MKRDEDSLMDIDAVSLTGEQFLYALEKADKSDDFEALQVLSSTVLNCYLAAYFHIFNKFNMESDLFSVSHHWDYKRTSSDQNQARYRTLYCTFADCKE
jgi:hypothetical protein